MVSALAQRGCAGPTRLRTIAELIKEGNEHYGRSHRSCYDVHPFRRAPDGTQEPPCDPLRSMDFAMHDTELGEWPRDGGAAPSLHFTCIGCSAPFVIFARIATRLRDVCPAQFRAQLDEKLPEFCRELERAAELGRALKAAAPAAPAPAPIAAAAPLVPGMVAQLVADGDGDSVGSVDSQDGADDDAAMQLVVRLERDDPAVAADAVFDDVDMGDAAAAAAAAAANVSSGVADSDMTGVAAAAVDTGGSGANETGVAAAAVDAGGSGANETGVAAAAVDAGGSGADGMGAAAPSLTPPGSAKRTVGGWGAGTGLGPKGGRTSKGLVMPFEGPITADTILRNGGTLMELLKSFSMGLGHEQRTVIQASAVARYKVKPADRDTSVADCVMDAANRCVPSRARGAQRVAYCQIYLSLAGLCRVAPRRRSKNGMHKRDYTVLHAALYCNCMRRFGKAGYSWVVFVFHIVVQTDSGEYIVVKCVMHVFQRQDWVQDTFAATAAYEATLRMLAASKIGKDVTTVSLQSGQFLCRARAWSIRNT